MSDELWMTAPDQAQPILEQLLQEASAVQNHETTSRAAARLAYVCLNTGDVERAESAADRALEQARAAHSEQLEAAAFNVKGELHYRHADYTSARPCFERCLELSRSSGYLEGEQAALNQLGILEGFHGRTSRALDCHRRCLEIDVRLGSAHGQVVSRINIGWALEQLGQWEEAAENLYRAIALSEQNGFEYWRLLATSNLAELYVKRHRLDLAIDMFRLVVDCERRNGLSNQVLDTALCILGKALHQQGDLGAAAKTYAEALVLNERTGDRRELAILMRRMAELALTRGELAEADEYVGRSASIAHELGLKREQGEVLRVRALLFAEHGEDAAARDCFERAVAHLSGTPDSYEMARIRLQYGRHLAAGDGRDRALVLLKQAAGTFRRLSVVAESEEANRLLFRLEMPQVGETALIAGVDGLIHLGLEPAAFFQRVLKFLCEGFACESGAIMREGTPVVVEGQPDSRIAAELAGCRETVSTGTAVYVPVSSGERTLAGVYLERSNPAEGAIGTGTLEHVAQMLVEPARRLAELPVGSTPDVAIAGLQYTGVVGHCKPMTRVLETVARVAGTNVPVLVRGESGTGKELVARAVHESGGRRGRPFVTVNCAAVPEALLEAEFFGVVKGAATGVAARKGKFEVADGGTVFLDEIGDMSLVLQAKLLRVLQERSFEPLGGRRTVTVDVRLVAATNQDLARLIETGGFRQDLYYRLNTVELVLPPLRERRDDIPDFVRYFIMRSNQEFGREVLGAGAEVMSRFLVYHWPGNIRELQHFVERAVILARGQVLELSDLPPEFQSVEPDESDGGSGGLRQVRREAQRRATDDVEPAMLRDCLDRAEWNVSKAAVLAGYSRAQFYRLLKKHDITRRK
jgi:transcriptional regulator with GAF, ATPase, and Fis domain/tetratricopeptide (TPR) repeat protein